MLYTVIGWYVMPTRANEITNNYVGFRDEQNASFHRANMCQVQYVILAVCWWLISVDGNVVRNEDICGAGNGRRLYLELGEKGILYAKNVTLVKNAPRLDSSRSPLYVTNSSHSQCRLELVTCPSCVVVVTFRSLSLFHHCGDGGVTMDSPCRCDYVWISEPPYDDVSGTPFCGLYSPISYRSSTRTLSIALLYSQSHKHAFTLEYTAERNRLHLKGAEMMTPGAKGINNTGGGILTSPFFPARYPRDLGVEYVITCATEAPSCRIRLLFSDFQLATVSIIEFYDWNGQRLDVSSGARFRPPVIVSSGPSLLIRFYANGGTGLGYKAFYSFVLGHLVDKSVQPITDCGGYVENLGGAITMMDMVGQGVKTYDCVWLIRPPKNFLHTKTHMYLKVVDCADMAGNTELAIRQGPTSALLPLEVLRHPASQLQPPRHREHVAPVASGFHVSLRGTFGPSSRLVIAYAAFSYMDCFAGSDFLCQNHRCIPSQLNCDGFDHCGDNSDEPATCFQDWEVESRDRKWHMNKANYYFPKIDRYPDLKTATLVFVASSLGLIILISALIILLYRMGARARQQRELQSRLQTISELLDGARIDEISVSDDPPVYEAPPGYDEVVKLSLETDGPRRKKRRSVSREQRSRSSPSRCSYDQDSRSASCLAIEAGASTSRSSQTTPVPTTAKRPTVPESPPPPYVTPPGTVRNLPATNENEQKTSRVRRARCAWIRRSGHFSQSLSSNERVEVNRPSSSFDPELLSTCLPDSEDGSAASATAQDDSSGAERQVGEVPDSAVGSDETEEAGAILCVASENEVDDTNSNGDKGCSCAGACACANQSGFDDVDFSDRRAILADDGRPCEEDARSSVSARGPSETGEDDGACPKTAIVRLLSGARSGSRRSAGRSARAVSSACSTPSGTLGRSFRKLSVCSRDSYVTKISSISLYSSYEKLKDDIEFVSEVASVGGLTSGPSEPNTVVSTPRGAPRYRADAGAAAPRRYSSCDLDSLYEGIRALDTFLARRAYFSGARRRSGHGRSQVVLVGERVGERNEGPSEGDDAASG